MGSLLNASGLRHQASRPAVDPGRAGWSPRTRKFARAAGMGPYRTVPEATTVAKKHRGKAWKKRQHTTTAGNCSAPSMTKTAP